METLAEIKEVVNQMTWSYTHNGNADLEFSIMEIEQTAKSYEERAKQLREGLKAEMEKSGVKKWETDNIVVTYVNATERKGIDTTRLKEEQPSIYEQYLKVTNVNSTIKIKLK